MGTQSAKRMLACPHCQAGVEPAVVGLCWDQDEMSWRCLLCGYRVFDRPRRSEAQIASDRLWEQIFPSVEDGEGGSLVEEGEPEEGSGLFLPGQPTTTLSTTETNRVWARRVLGQGPT